MSEAAEIDSEAKKNEIVVSSSYTNYCLVIMEQQPMPLAMTAPRWRISATLQFQQAAIGPGIEASLPFITIRPLQHTRQVVAIAKVPMVVVQWTFRFECDEGRAKALVWFFPGMATLSGCGIFEVPHG